MLVDVTNVKFKNNVYLANIEMFDNTSMNDVLILSSFGFSSNPMNASKGYLLQSGHGNYFLLAIDDFKKQQADKNEVVLYNEQALVRLSKDNKIEIKNSQTDLKTTLDKLVDKMGELADAVYNTISSELQAQAKIYPTSIVLTKFKSTLQNVKQEIGGLLK